MTPYEIIKVLKDIGFSDMREWQDKGKYHFPSYQYTTTNAPTMLTYYKFEVGLNGIWVLTKSRSNAKTIYVYIDCIVEFIGNEFGLEYFRDYNIEKVLR